MSGVQSVQLIPGPARDTEPPDAVLRIVRGNDGKALHYILSSPLGRLGYRNKPVGVVPVPTLKDPVLLLSGLFQELDHLARQPVDGLTEEERRAGVRTIQSLGNNLYADLFPDELKEEYWRLVALRNAGKINSLLVLSDEPWIPWEMVLPYEDDQPEEDFLCMGWRFSRWCASRGLAPQLQVQAAQLVAPALDLEYVQAERRYFEELARRNLTVRPPITRRGAFLELMETGGVQLCHIASHGRFDAADVDRSPIIMEDDELLPTDLAPVHTRGLRQERPLIFLNACHAGRVDFTLTGIGGWAQRVVDHLAATAFIGAYWEVHDELAAGFAAAFYDELGQGALLGDALRAARRVTRARQPANPTWLAYTLYGHPNAQVKVGR
ncbi:MAG: CHAT domain-containing protein [Caldilineae bacterium]|nr:MAG: CHAT domain-containing protein [Caldilineae bacterium]